jgi:hypothetical protein
MFHSAYEWRESVAEDRNHVNEMCVLRGVTTLFECGYKRFAEQIPSIILITLCNCLFLTLVLTWLVQRPFVYFPILAGI